MGTEALENQGKSIELWEALFKMGFKGQGQGETSSPVVGYVGRTREGHTQARCSDEDVLGKTGEEAGIAETQHMSAPTPSLVTEPAHPHEEEGKATSPNSGIHSSPDTHPKGVEGNGKC